MRRILIILILLGIIFNIVLARHIESLSLIDIVAVLSLSLIYIVLFKFVKLYSKSKVLNKELAVERDNLKEYINLSKFILLVLDKQGRVEFINQRGCELLGQDQEEIIGSFWFKEFNQNQQKIKLLERVVKGEVELPNYTSGTLVDKDGNERIIGWYNSTLKDEAGNVEEIISSGVDMSKERLVKEKFIPNKVKENSITDISKHLNYSLELIFSALKVLGIVDVIFIVVNKEQKITFFNQGGFKEFGYSEKEVVGESIFKFYQGDGIEAKSFFKRLFNEEEEVPEYVETEVLTKYGTVRIVSWHLARLKDNNGEIQGVFGSGIDITERKWLEERVESNKAQGEFFANLSHEMRTPLNLIFSAVQMQEIYTKRNLDKDNYNNLSKYSKIMRRNIYRLLRLINNLVDITKIDANFYDFNLQNHNIVELIDNIVLSVKDYLDSSAREISFESELFKRVITCDATNIERIMLNLLSNAVKFSNKGDKIIVRIFEEQQYIYISVKDTGIGIKEEQKKIIFERFGQADKSFTRRKEGSGIGLVIVKLLVEMHGGEIEVESEYGKGSEFIIKLPNIVLEKEDIEFAATEISLKEELIDRIDIEFSDIYEL
ncbi:PAS domain S-box-containing protein [Orenia metallireducens]|jgi:PAS domain S-box-containing protein|uniref:sensor histidine kinase n=1 Tax=Orenia metallireducens TaxID=1413210 RepID=UPI000D050C7A|nr:PAS domain-containing sensor histidine kinase [Orenia metallireducens]PRX30374.1 PAS domain S-box-containing protein [Orenia metallireducens]